MDSSIWLYIALGIVILGLIIAGVGVFLMIKGIKEPIKQIKGSADNLKDRLDKLKFETTSLQHNANEIKEDMKVKSEKISVTVDAAKGTKNSVLDLNASVKAITGNIASKVDRDKRNAAQVNQWTNVTFGLLDLYENRKNPNKTTRTYAPTPVSETRQR